MTVTPANISAIQAHLMLNFGPGNSNRRLYRRYWPFLAVLNKRPAVASTAVALVSGARADSTIFAAEGSDFPDASTTAKKKATWGFTEPKLTAAVSDIAAAIARKNSLPGAAEIMASEAADAAYKIWDGLEASCFTGDYTATPPELAGLTAAGGSSSFGGVTTSDIATWAGKSASPGAGSLAAFTADPVTYLREKMIAPIRTAGGRCDFAFAQSDMLSILKGGLAAYPSQVEVVRTPNGDLKVSEVSTDVVRVENCYFIESPQAPANKIAFVSSESVEYQYVDFEGLVASGAMDITVEEMSKALREIARNIPPDVIDQLLRRPSVMPPMNFAQLGKKATRRELGVSHAGQLAWLERAHHGILTLTA